MNRLFQRNVLFSFSISFGHSQIDSKNKLVVYSLPQAFIIKSINLSDLQEAQDRKRRSEMNLTYRKGFPHTFFGLIDSMDSD